MPGSDLEDAQAILASGGTGDPGLDQQLKTFVEANRVPARQALQTESQVVPGPPVEDRLAKKGMDLLAQPLSMKRSPTAYYPTKEKNDFPILYTEPSGSSDPESRWEEAMSDAEKRGQRIYRTEKEFPVTGDNIPLAKRAQNALVRTATDVVTPFVFGADKSVTGGLATKGSVKALEKSGVVPEGTLGDVNRQVASSPITAGMGTMAGALAPGLTKGAGALGKKLVEPLMTSPVKKALGYGLAGALAGGLTGAVESGVGKAMGEDRNIGADAATSATIGALSNMVFGGLGELGRNRTAALRDPQKSDIAQDVALVEKAGAKSKLGRGFRPDTTTPQGQQMQSTLDELSAEARKSGQGLDALAADKAAKKLGQEVSSYQGETLGAAKDANAPLYESGATVSADRLVKKNLELLRNATHPDGGELPGHSISALRAEIPKLANVKLVDAASDEAMAADPDMLLPAGMAQKFGLVKGSGLEGKVVVLEPKNFTAKQLDDFTRVYHQQADLGVFDPTGERSQFGKLGHEGVVTRGRFGAGVEKMKLEQGAALNEMKNTLEAAGLPRDADVDLSQLGTQKALYGAMRGYKTGNAVPADDMLDAFALKRDPSLRSLMDTSASVGALQRLRGQATPDINLRSGISPYGVKGWAKIQLDPVFRGLGRMGETVPGLPYGAGLVERKRR